MTWRKGNHRISTRLDAAANIPVGWGLKVPVSRQAVTSALVKLKKRGIAKRFEYVANKSHGGGCIIYHVKWFVGKPFPVQLPTRRPPFPKGYWDSIFRSVTSGRLVTIQAPITAVYEAAHLRVKLGRASSKNHSLRKSHAKRKRVRETSEKMNRLSEPSYKHWLAVLLCVPGTACFNKATFHSTAPVPISSAGRKHVPNLSLFARRFRTTRQTAISQETVL